VFPKISSNLSASQFLQSSQANFVPQSVQFFLASQTRCIRLVGPNKGWQREAKGGDYRCAAFSELRRCRMGADNIEALECENR
jgi:hypothetical protein